MNFIFSSLGMLTFLFTLFIFVVGVIFPDLYAPLAVPQVKETEIELLKYSGRDSQILARNSKFMDAEAHTKADNNGKSSDQGPAQAVDAPEAASEEEEA
jgi:hypothetical protein